MSRKFLAFDVETAKQFPGDSWMTNPIQRERFTEWLG